MNDDNVISLANHAHSGAMWSVEQMLEDALKEVRENPGEWKKAVVLYVNDDGKYSTSFAQAGMSMSEILALMEVQKMTILRMMGHVMQSIDD